MNNNKDNNDNSNNDDIAKMCKYETVSSKHRIIFQNKLSSPHDTWGELKT